MRERMEKSIDEVLSISFNFLMENGLENTSIRDLAKETGMSLGSLYYWFTDKDDLVLNAVKYGLARSSKEIFENAFTEINNPQVFVESIIDLVRQEQKKLRVVFQAATSPVYGDAIRSCSTTLNGTYDECIMLLSEQTGMPYDEIRPLVYLMIATILDFVVWDDFEFSKKQIEYIHGIFEMKKKSLVN